MNAKGHILVTGGAGYIGSLLTLNCCAAVMLLPWWTVCFMVEESLGFLPTQTFALCGLM